MAVALFPYQGTSGAGRAYRLRTLFRSLRQRRRRQVWSQNALQNRTNADGKQGLLGIAQKIDDATFGVPQEDAFPVGEQVQAGTARYQIGKSMAEFATQQREHFANALQAETTAAKITEYGQFGKILGGIEAAMALAGRHYDSLLIPPLELTWREAGAFGNLAGRKARVHPYTKPTAENR